MDAAKVLFVYLANIVFNVRKAYIASLKRFKKQSSKEERADEHMEEWASAILERNWIDDVWYDTSYKDEFLKYTKKHFVTYDEKCKTALQAAKILKPLLDGTLKEGLQSGSITLEEIKKEFVDILSEKKADKIFKRLEKAKEQETIISFPYKDWIEENQDSDDFF